MNKNDSLMTIQGGNWDLVVDLVGGRIISLSHTKKRVVGSYHRMDGKMGTTHLCIPSFDKEGQEKYNLPFHGLVRNKEWMCKNKTERSLTLSCEISPSLSYPARLSVEQEFRLDGDFIHTIRITHLEGEGVPLNIGCHYYWDTPEGWHETQINGINMKEIIKTNGYIGLKRTNTITFPHAVYELTSSEFQSAMLWTSFKVNEKGNRIYNEDFCCIEPIIKWPHYFGSEPSIIRPGKSVSASIHIKKVV